MPANRCSEANKRIPTKYLTINQQTPGQTKRVKTKRGRLGSKIAQQHSSKEETEKHKAVLDSGTNSSDT